MCSCRYSSVILQKCGSSDHDKLYHPGHNITNTRFFITKLATASESHWEHPGHSWLPESNWKLRKKKNTVALARPLNTWPNQRHILPHFQVFPVSSTFSKVLPFFHISKFLVSTLLPHLFSLLMSSDSLVWQDDDAVTQCFLCESTYNFFNRRHHCRKCGRVVCGNCSDQSIQYFPNTLVVNPNGVCSRLKSWERYRTCDECVETTLMIRRALAEEVDPYTAPDAASSDDNNSTTKTAGNTFTRMVSSSTNSSRLQTTIMVQIIIFVPCAPPILPRNSAELLNWAVVSPVLTTLTCLKSAI